MTPGTGIRSETDAERKADRHTEDTKHEASAIAGEAKASASESAEDLKRQAQEAGRKVKQQAGVAQRRVQEQGERWVEQGKGRVTGELSTFREAIRRAASKLEEDNETKIASYANAAADYLERAEQHLGNRDARGLIRDARGFVRRQPEVAFGGLFLAGLAAARFIKASASHDYDDHDYGQGPNGGDIFGTSADHSASRVHYGSQTPGSGAYAPPANPHSPAAVSPAADQDPAVSPYREEL